MADVAKFCMIIARPWQPHVVVIFSMVIVEPW